MKNSFERQNRENEQKYLNGIETTKFNTDKKIQDIQKNSENTIKTVNLDSVNQKRDLSRRHQQTVDEIRKDHSIDLEKKGENSLKKIQEITRNKDSEIAVLNERHDFNLEKNKQEEKELFDNTLSRYENHTKDLLKSFQTKYNRYWESQQAYFRHLTFQERECV